MNLIVDEVIKDCGVISLWLALRKLRLCDSGVPLFHSRQNIEDSSHMSDPPRQRLTSPGLEDGWMQPPSRGLKSVQPA